MLFSHILKLYYITDNRLTKAGLRTPVPVCHRRKARFANRPLRNLPPPFGFKRPLRSRSNGRDTFYHDNPFVWIGLKWKPHHSPDARHFPKWDNQCSEKSCLSNCGSTIGIFGELHLVRTSNRPRSSRSRSRSRSGPLPARAASSSPNLNQSRPSQCLSRWQALRCSSK